MNGSFKESEEWEALLNLLKQGKKNSSFQPILWVGAGLSVPVGYPTTDQLIEVLKDRSLKKLPEFLPSDVTLPIASVNRSFTLWVQNFAKINGYSYLNKSLASIFSLLSHKPSITHIELVKNPWKSIFTTNYDPLLEAALNQNEIKFNTFTQESNYGLEQDNIISLYKIHGGITNISDWTLDEQSYLNFSDKYPFIEAKLKTTLFPHSIVYVGCSMLDPRVIDWYQYCADKKLSNQLGYSIVIIRKCDWTSLPLDLQRLYSESGIHPLFFDDFTELPTLFKELNNELNSPINGKKSELLNIDAEALSNRENEILDEILYEIVSPRVINIIASLWLEASDNISYIERLKEIDGVRAKNKGEIAFKILLEDFVDLSKRLIGNQLSFQDKKNTFILLDSILDKYFPPYQVVEEVGYKPHIIHGSLQVEASKDKAFDIDEKINIPFNNILKDFCEFIIDCCRALPSWKKENLVSQLKDHELLFEKLREELGRWKESSSNEVDEVVLIEDEYRREIARRFDELKIFGLSFGKKTRKYQLSVAYISLTTETDFNDSEDNKVMSTNEALTSYDRLVILGEAGQGKTTLLQWLTVQCGRRSFENEQIHFNKKIPVLIQLRSILNGTNLPNELDFYSFMTEGIETETTHREWIDSILENHLAIIMIDGFDEVPKERRQEVLDWINRLCERYNGNQFILTSRPSAYENTSLEHLDFNVIQLQTMDRKAQSDFVEHWHHAIALEYDKTKPDALRQEAKNLLEKLRQQKVLRNLAQNPLLCGVLCMLHHDRSGYLPKDKTDLYESTCRLFLDSRDREKKVIETDKFSLLDLRNKESFLSDIAYWMTCNGKTSISPEILKRKLRVKSRDMPELRNNISSEELQLFFLERSGLLVQVGLNEIQFTHRTFQEFYTAKYIISENDIDSLSNNAGNDYWNGTIQLAIGLRTSKTENEKYLTELLTKANDFDSIRDFNSATSLYLLVLSCKESMREISPKFSFQLKQVIKKIVPPPTAKVRDALASAGSIAVPYLARPKGGRSIVKDHYCALALIKIATPDAYVMLKDYFKDNRSSYIPKLCSDIKKMDCEVIKDSNLVEMIIADGIGKYDQSLRVMLSFLTQEPMLIEKGIDQGALLDLDLAWKLSQGLAPLSKLNVDDVVELDLSFCVIEDLDILNKFYKLKKLEFFYTNIRNFPSLTNLKNLTHLSFFGCSLENNSSFSEIKCLSTLKSLEITRGEVDDISFLSNLPLLEYLHISKVSTTDLTSIASLKKLKYLNLSAVKSYDISFLWNLRELTELILLFNSIEDLSPLTNLINLRKIRLMCSIETSELSAISQLTELTELHFSFAGIDDLSFITNLKKLEKLNLSSNDIIELLPLSDLNELEVLNLSNNKLVDLLPLSDLKNLKVLDLSHNEIVDLLPLSALNYLDNLDLSSNEIVDVLALTNLKELKCLDLSCTNIYDITSLYTLTKLKEVDLSYTRINSLKSLEKLNELIFVQTFGLRGEDLK